MSPEVQFVLYSLFVFAAVFLPGLATLSIPAVRSRVSLNKKEMVAASVGVSCIIYAVVAIAIIAVPTIGHAESAVATLSVVCIASLILLVRDRYWRRVPRLGAMIGILGSLTLFVTAILILSAPFDPSHTSGGDNIASSRLPFYTLDCYIPYRAAQVFANHLPLSLDPYGVRTGGVGPWYVTDRTPLLSLVSLVLILGTGFKFPDSYLFLEPIKWTVLDPYGYFLFRAIAAALNSAFVMPVSLLAARLFDNRVAKVTVLLTLINAFMLENVVFAWPKLLATYFVLMYFYFLVTKRWTMAGVFGGLGFLSHPFATIFIVSGMALALAKVRWTHGPTLVSGRQFAKLVLGLVAVACPWLAWSALVGPSNAFLSYTIPVKAELVAMLSSRLHDGYVTIVPVLLARVPGAAPVMGISADSVVWWELDKLTWQWFLYFNNNSNLTGALTIWLAPFAYFGLVHGSTVRREVAFLTFVPFLVGIAYWGMGTNFGLLSAMFQPLVPILIAVGSSVILKARRVGLPVSVLYFAENMFYVWNFVYRPVGLGWVPDIFTPLLLFFIYGAGLVAISASFLSTVRSGHGRICIHL